MKYLLLLALLPTLLPAEVFQYRVPAVGHDKEGQVFLWVPPDAPRVRGILAAGMTLMEPYMVNDPAVRAVCREQSLAILFSTCGIRQFKLQETLDSLAEQSGLPELSSAPLFFAGHSAGGPQAMDRAKDVAERCFGLMQFRGGLPYGVDPAIPSLVMMGQFDEFGGVMRFDNGREHAWERPRDELAKLRSEAPGRLASLYVEPGAGHFAWTERNAAIFAPFLREAAARQIQDDGTLRRVDPASGWLTLLDLRAEPFVIPAIDFNGDPATVAWHFDEASARRVNDAHSDLRSPKKDQFIRWENKHWIDAGVRYFFSDMEIVGDGRSFRVRPAYASSYPTRQGEQGPQWLQAGQPVGNSGAPFRVYPVGGPIEVVGPLEFRVRHSTLHPVESVGRMTFLAQSPGNAEYRFTEIVGMAPRGWKGPGRGPAQSIDFPAPADMRVGAEPQTLLAKASSGLPVDFYVARGPAVIRDNQIVLSDVPTRAKLPIEIEVVAYQLGSGVEPTFSPAASVRHVFRLLP
jgi:hypothetical protein